MFSRRGGSKPEHPPVQLNQETYSTDDRTNRAYGHGMPPHQHHTGYEPSARYVPNEQSMDDKHVGLSTYAVPGSTQSSNVQPLTSFDEPKKPGIRVRFRFLFDLLQGLLIFSTVGVLLAIPIIITADARESKDGDDKTRQTKNLVYYVFLMLISTWGMTAAFYLVALVLPYLFRFIAHFINPAQKKYWRVFVIMRRPITLLFAVVSGYISLQIWFWDNPEISSYNNAAGETIEDQEVSQIAYENTVSTIARILLYLVLWAGAYFFEKILITYLAIHYHYRANHQQIERSKTMLEALVELFNYSNTVYPRGDTMFAVEDYVIYNALNTASGQHSIAKTSTGVLDKLAGNFTQAFGIVFGAESASHWLTPRASYSIVGRALEHDASSAALAKRIWVSLVAEDRTALTVKDLKDALGPKEHDKAVAFFNVLDENENGDVRLDELVPTIVEAGKKRRDIYAGMGNIDHVINTLDWIALGWLAIIMTALCLISEVWLFAQMKEVIGFTALGLSFVIGRTLNEIIQGAIFTILDHPYDVGDIVEMYTLAENNKVLMTVKKVSLLYTVFEEVGNNKMVQYTNMRSKIKRITNLSRSGKNREAITLGVDFTTSFTDLQLLRQELQNFVSAPENSRDYFPDLGLRVTNLCDLQRLELCITFIHKSNWSNESLRAARSSRFHCAVVAAVRRVPINKPGFTKTTLGDEGKPSYTVMITDTEAAAKRAAETEKYSAKRMDYVKPEPEKKSEDEEEQAELTEEEKAAADEKKAEAKRKADEKAAKDAQAKLAETEATITLMGIDREINERNTSASTGLGLLNANGHSRFGFITGTEKGSRTPFTYHATR